MTFDSLNFQYNNTESIAAWRFTLVKSGSSDHKMIFKTVVFQRNKTEMVFRFLKIGRELGQKMIFGFLTLLPLAV